MDRSTLTRNLRPLIERGLVKTTDSKDGRTKSVGLTNKGRQALCDAVPYWKTAQDGVVSRLGDERWERILQDLGEIVAAARQQR